MHSVSVPPYTDDTSAAIETFISKYRVMETCINRICSCCLRSGFVSTPVFCRWTDDESIYLCDDCHVLVPKEPGIGFWTETGWYANGPFLIEGTMSDVEKAPSGIIKVVRARGSY
jgi:hypothetical protein